jgi:hypothetical protein
MVEEQRSCGWNSAEYTWEHGVDGTTQGKNSRIRFRGIGQSRAEKESKQDEQDA